jgi:hypothetical protein
MIPHVAAPQSGNRVVVNERAKSMAHPLKVMRPVPKET